MCAPSLDVFFTGSEMSATSDLSDGQFFDSSKYLKLEIDKDGKWFQNGAEIIHPGIRSQFFQALVKTADGDYLVKIGREICSVIVQDAPFVVTTVDKGPRNQILIRLSDESVEELKPDSLWIGDDNVPYVFVKNGSFHARFSRPAYYQLAKSIIYKEDEGKIYLIDGNREVEVKTEAPSQIKP